ncbi:hypothetical protein MJO29_012659 [Puccinia striiformis f. sp. tritici]|nr:hypothetical protein MJO29_012659 [Puccinia striiformis f. sp. tritici]KAI9614118.1 hypothetical protein KEM48_006096 [Puccinia striiformis f. sp. tritici PST-130]
MQFEMVFTFVPPLALLSAGPIIRGSPQAEVIWPLGPSTTPITGSTSGVSYIQQVLGDPSPLQMQNRTIDELSLPQVIKNAPSPSPPPPIALKRKPTRQKRGPNSKVVPLISSAPEPSHSGKPLHKPQLLTTLVLNHQHYLSPHHLSSATFQNLALAHLYRSSSQVLRSVHQSARCLRSPRQQPSLRWWLTIRSSVIAPQNKI